ncbi:MAG: Fe-S cluster assembly transcriptional regulator IscR [Proteobacteria bacterium]|nr:MAG: Fe-S cluster assembly transcriptional regulator IscR [Pseudomonadota bacterium]
MKLTTQSQRAVMAMIALALHNERKVLRLSNLAKEQGISLSYMEQLFYALRHAGLVEGIRGPGGGYRLGKPASRISIADIVEAIESSTSDEEEREARKSDIHSGQTVVDQMLSVLDEQVHDFLSGISLESLTHKHRKPEAVYRPGTTASLIARMFPARLPQPAGA